MTGKGGGTSRAAINSGSVSLCPAIKTTMPSDTVGVYDIQLVTDVIAFMLKANGFPAGSVDLPKDAEPLKDITIKAGKPDGQ